MMRKRNQVCKLFYANRTSYSLDLPIPKHVQSGLWNSSALTLAPKRIRGKCFLHSVVSPTPK